jgi:hypothetical protein
MVLVFLDTNTTPAINDYSKYGNYTMDIATTNTNYANPRLSTVVKIDNIDDFISFAIQVYNHPSDINIANPSTLVIMKVGDL